ncbi:hypothetical protein NC652_033670 [Populus alba x Populus x berolinensis]|nr:hypothetical protein NC652_033670 [Populus alba x Populus x berolinensis]
MATISDIGVAAAINILTAFAFFIVFAILRIQPVNDRVYFPKWSYVRFLNWMPAALQMPEPELIDHAGLDSAVYLRIYLTGLWLKIFVPIAFLAFTISVPVNWTNNTLEHSNLTYSDLDKLSISNIPTGSCRFGNPYGDGLCFYLLDMLCAKNRVLVRIVPPDPDESV